jgi:hypothetical protein
MIKVFLRGGLGNQLFQYAAGLFLAQNQGEKIVFRTDLLPICKDSIANISRWPNQLSEFNSVGLLSQRKPQPAGSTHLLSKKLQILRFFGDIFPKFLLSIGILSRERISTPPFSNLPRIWLVDSYCSSAIPALYLGDNLRDQIRSIKDPSTQFSNLLQEAISARPIVIHVRLGDYQNLKHLYGEPKYERIETLVRSLGHDNKTEVWLFTDSPEAIEQKMLVRTGVTKVIGPNQLDRPIENLVLMSMGSKLICSNSTFSWWAAFLMGEGGNVFYPASANMPHEIFSGNMVIKGWKAF